MRILLIVFIFISSTHIVSAMEKHTFKTIIEGIKSERGGQLIIFVFLQDGFPKQHDKAIAQYIYPANTDRLELEILVPAEQPFALKVLHDKNMDGKVSKNWTGIVPSDGLGFSNKARIRFSAPSFDQALIRHAQQPHNISIQYF